MTSRTLDLIRAATWHLQMEAPVLEIGSFIEEHQEHLDIRQAFARNTTYVGVDLIDGTGVDRQADLLNAKEMIGLADEVAPKTILCLYVIEHVWNIVQAANTLGKIWRRNPESWLWVVTHQNQPYHGTEQYPDYWRLTRTGMRRLFEEAGVEGVHVLVYPDTSNPEDVVVVRQPMSSPWPDDNFSKVSRAVRERWEEA